MTNLEYELNASNLLFRFDEDPSGSGVCWCCAGENGLCLFIDPCTDSSAWDWKATLSVALCIDGAPGHMLGRAASRELAVMAALEALANAGGDVSRLPGWLPLDNED